jgi:cystathionine beta-lyase/cystathionine gamma-synthase
MRPPKKSKEQRRLSLSTKAIHGAKLFAYRGPVATPIYQTSTYRFASSDEPMRFAKGDADVHVYTRYHNPNFDDVESKIALMEGAESAALFSSGMAAISTALLAVTDSGQEIVSTPALYGGTYRFFRDDLSRRNVPVKYIDPSRLTDLKKLITARTSVVYFETPTNPTLSLVDMQALVRHTRSMERVSGRPILIMADNTFATIINQNPFAYGVDAVIESATKYLGGHSDLLGGVVLGSQEFIKRVKQSAKYYGGCADPFAAFLLSRSLKTFELRVKKQNDNAIGLAKALERNRHIQRVLHPGLKSHPQHGLAKAQMTGYGGMVTIEVRPSKGKSAVESAASVVDHLRIAVNAMSLGGVETLVSIPVYSSHIFMSDEELALHGVTPGMIRISVGIEGLEDLISDFTQALEYA